MRSVVQKMQVKLMQLSPATECTGGSMSQVVELPNNSYKLITNTTWVPARLCKLQKRVQSLAAASDKLYQLLAHGRQLSPASSTTKTVQHDIAESGVKTQIYDWSLSWLGTSTSIKSDGVNLVLWYMWMQICIDF